VGSRPDRVNPKTTKFVFVASPLSTHRHNITEIVLKVALNIMQPTNQARRKKSKYWLARNQDNVFEWGDMSTQELLFQLASTIKVKLSVLI
jgi:hypothetical protein